MATAALPIVVTIVTISRALESGYPGAVGILRTLGVLDIITAAVLLVVALFLDGTARLTVVITAIVVATAGSAAWVVGSRRGGTPT